MSLSALRKGGEADAGGSNLSALQATLKKAMEKQGPTTPPPIIDIPAGQESFGDVPTEEERDIPATVARLRREAERDEEVEEASVLDEAQDEIEEAPASPPRKHSGQAAAPKMMQARAQREQLQREPRAREVPLQQGISAEELSKMLEVTPEELTARTTEL